MFSVDLNTIEVPELGGGFSVTFPFSSATGAAATAAVYLLFEPGAVLAEHTDSAEEVLLVLEGAVEATVGGETAMLGQGQLAIVPALALHGMRNVGDTPARVIGFFASSTNVAVFPEPPAPGMPRLLVVGAEPGQAVPVAQMEAATA